MPGEESNVEEFRVTFNPPLYLERQRWVLDILRREAVKSVLDIGCGEGFLLQCLTVPAQFRPPSKLPVPSSFVLNDYHADLHLQEIHGLDPCPHDLEFAICGTAPPSSDDPPYTGYDRWRTRQARWMSLEVSLWEGGFENIHDDFKGDKIDAFVASEVIEHLPPNLLCLFAPVLLGYYRPRILLLTTPNYTYNQRFSPPGERSLTGYPDPTGRTERVFRHHDHKFEWTTEEWTRYCNDAALKFGYDVQIGGVGVADSPDPWDRDNILGFASQVAAFKRRDFQPLLLNMDAMTDGASAQRPILREKHIHFPHPLSQLELDRRPMITDIHQAVKDMMNDYGQGTMTFDSVWNNGVVSLKCAGDIAALAYAFQGINLDDDEWSVMDYVKGWEATIVWKNFVTPDATLRQICESPDGSTSSQGIFDQAEQEEISGKAEECSPRSGPLLLDEATTPQAASCGWGEGDGLLLG